MKRKIALVNQRYGLEVNGGSELHCRQLAEKLLDFYDVEVLTTCAVDYITWENEYPQGIEKINGVTVRRFKTSKPRDMMSFNALSQKVLSQSEKHTLEAELTWIKEQGPYSPDFLTYIKSHENEYDAIIYMTYLYFLTATGIFHAKNGHIYLLPTAHDEPPIYLDYYKSVFQQARGLIYNTEEEQTLVENLFPVSHKKSIIAGVGVEIPQTELPSIRKMLPFQEDYILYVGRIDESKGCVLLFEYFLKYLQNSKTKVKLVLVGKPVMDVPNDPNIVSLGFVSDEVKFAAIQGCKALVLASEFESLSMVVLESLAMERPVLVNGNCDVLKGHCERSGAGFYFTNFSEFCVKLNFLLHNSTIYQEMKENGKKYVTEHYNWTVIMNRITTLLEEGWEENSKKEKNTISQEDISKMIAHIEEEVSQRTDKVSYLSFDDVKIPSDSQSKVLRSDLFELDELLLHMEQVNQQWNYRVYREIERLPGLRGMLVYLLKKIVRKMIHFYVDPMIHDQVTYNSSVANSLNQMRNFILEQDFEQKEGNIT